MEEKVNALWVNLIRFQLKYRYPIIILVGILTVIFCFNIHRKLEIKTDFFELYPPKHPYIQLYKEFRDMFGSANVLSSNLPQTIEEQLQLILPISLWDRINNKEI